MSDASITLCLISRRELGGAVHEMTFAHISGKPLGAYAAGAHLTLRAPSGDWRSYSLCGAPTDQQYWTVAIKREDQGRGGSRSLVDSLSMGDAIEVLPPQNFFPLVVSARSYLFIAGGIGITPIYAMIQHLVTLGRHDFRLIYCTRDEPSTAYRHELMSLIPPERLMIHHDDGRREGVFDFWPYLESPGAEHIYCCGPAGLMDDVRDMTGHWPKEQVHFESFSGAQVPASQNVAFEVVLKSSGEKLHVPADQSLLDVLRAAGVQVTSSCESGSCGSCRTGLVSGDAAHRDLVLDAHERACAIMPCVSRSQGGTLVLDL